MNFVGNKKAECPLQDTQMLYDHSICEDKTIEMFCVFAVLI